MRLQVDTIAASLTWPPAGADNRSRNRPIVAPTSSARNGNALAHGERRGRVIEPEGKQLHRRLRWPLSRAWILVGDRRIIGALRVASSIENDDERGLSGS